MIQNDPEWAKILKYSNLHEIWYPTKLRDADFKSDVYLHTFIYLFLVF